MLDIFNEMNVTKMRVNIYTEQKITISFDHAIILFGVAFETTYRFHQLLST